VTRENSVGVSQSYIKSQQQQQRQRVQFVTTTVQLSWMLRTGSDFLVTASADVTWRQVHCIGHLHAGQYSWRYCHMTIRNVEYCVLCSWVVTKYRRHTEHTVKFKGYYQEQLPQRNGGSATRAILKIAGGKTHHASVLALVMHCHFWKRLVALPLRSKIWASKNIDFGLVQYMSYFSPFVDQCSPS